MTTEWFKNGSRIQSNVIQESVGVNDVTTTSLWINSIKLKDSGNYTCKGSNEFGNVSKTVGVVVNGK